MRYFALACDYDGTIAHDGVVAPETLEGLRRVVASGRRLLLVTGRELDDLLDVFPEIDVFDWVVAENGALLYKPSTKEEIVAAAPIKPEFAAALRKRKLDPLSTGRVIVSTRQPNETIVLETIRELGLELQVIFNKGAVMVLPSGVNKATGLALALKQLDLSIHNVVGVGDAENDHAFLSTCEFSVALANALPTLKERVDLVTKRENGAGVAELIDRLLADDLASAPRRDDTLMLGKAASGEDIVTALHGPSILLAGMPGSGKSTLAKWLLEQLTDRAYQFCVVDPEGDYEDFEAGVVLGNRGRVPGVGEVLQVLKDPAQNAVVNLLGVPLDERPRYFSRLIADLVEMRSRTGRPHWLILDETHHILPSDHPPASQTLPGDLTNVVFITVLPQEVLTQALGAVGVICTMGDTGAQTLADFAKAVGRKAPALPKNRLEKGEAFVWALRGRVRRLRVPETRFEHRRHRRKYAEGELGPDFSFYFRGAEAKLSLRAQNLTVFAQLAQGVDDDTWSYHLRLHDYSRWFRDVIKDDELAAEAAKAEESRSLAPAESRQIILEAIGKRYTLPVGSLAKPETP